jgi:hypothetical protein
MMWRSAVVYSDGNFGTKADTFSSAGVQVGAAQSQFGVLGTWTTVFHERDDPLGK